ncbi:hypothetical protein GCM10023213_14240 [Prosthecobacter algae]|uniref:Uncharacterized protein n=1 Tax=Prosthecobacter algae TaxID=1144682 RepID=A0ABP9NZL7_9BACT
MNHEHPILRRHRLITQGQTEAARPDIAAVMAANLQLLAHRAHAKQTPSLQIAPPRPRLHELLSRAAQTAQTFTHNPTAPQS